MAPMTGEDGKGNLGVIFANKNKWADGYLAVE